MPGSHSDMCIVRVRRTRLVEDALSEISRQWKKDLFKVSGRYRGTGQLPQRALLMEDALWEMSRQQ